MIAGVPHGVAVEIGSRVAALARPGELLVTRTVVDLVAGSGLRFAVAACTRSRKDRRAGECMRSARRAELRDLHL
jgi:class 3 adenylate cyclase